MEKVVKEEKIPLENEANDAVLFAARTYCLVTPSKRYKKNKDISNAVYEQVKSRKRTIAQTIMSKRDKTILKFYALAPNLTVTALSIVRSITSKESGRKNKNEVCNKYACKSGRNKKSSVGFSKQRSKGDGGIS